MYIGITERGDAALDLSWQNKRCPKILITKDPNKLIKNTKDFNKCIVHCTITGLGGTEFEPNVPDPEVSLDAYRRLVKFLGPNRVVLRVDPLFPSDERILNKQLEIFKYSISRTRISFLDMFPHVIARLNEKEISLDISGYKNKTHYPLDERLNILNRIKNTYTSKFDIEICGEPGMGCSGCVSMVDIKALGLTLEPKVKTFTQRSACLCLAEKKELLTNKGQCLHGCIYCYWQG